jgi:hypothetical protein
MEEETKKFNGEVYRLKHRCRILRSANEHVRRMKAQGKDARVYKAGRNKYHVYSRSKK